MGTRVAAGPVDPDKLHTFLGKGETFGVPGAEVEQVTTHAAEIYLVGERAFKMKRAVRYSFLDFSTLERRRQALEAELRLNRRTAPMLYHRVLPVTREEGGSLAIDGDGEPVEWLLEMQRFDQAALLDRIAQRHALEPGTIDALAATLAAFHDAAERRPDLGGHAAMAEVTHGNAADLTSLIGPVFEAAPVHALAEATRAALGRARGLLEQRRADGFVRRCHGDLHLGNIVLLDGAPVLFDCLEFDEALATIDTFYDLGFLLMDLLHRDLGALAQRLLSGYLEATWDDAGTALLPLFLSCRAAIRAKVEGFAAQSETGEAPEQISAARAYLDLAQRFLAPEPPRLIAIGGVSGTGKTTLARALAPDLGAAPGAVILRSDVVRKKLFGAAPTERLGPGAYSEEVSANVYDALRSRARTLLGAGHSVIVDAVYLESRDRTRIEEVATDTGVPFAGFWLTAPAETLLTRVRSRNDDASDATAAVLQAQLEVDPGTIGWSQLDAAGDPGTVAAGARAVLARSARQ
jgi:aminoglycoside phosphotransferase family enzyme/predicted kinase